LSGTEKLASIPTASLIVSCTYCFFQKLLHHALNCLQEDSIFFCRVLKTPTEEIWPGVSQLPDYKATFPNWVHNNLTSHAKNIEEDGLDLLKVLVQVVFCECFSIV